MNNHSYEPDILLVYKLTALSQFGYTAYIPTKNQRYRRDVLTGLALVYSLTALNQFTAPKQYVLLLMMMMRSDIR